MIYCEAPSNKEFKNKNTLFLGGGISNCWDWQHIFTDVLKELDDNWVIFNPRRDSFDMSENGDIQVKWEVERLIESDFIVFYFTKDTIQPITLLEYGKYALSGEYKDKKVFVFVEDGYERKADLVLQTDLAKTSNIVLFKTESDMTSDVFMNKVLSNLLDTKKDEKFNVIKESVHRFL